MFSYFYFSDYIAFLFPIAYNYKHKVTCLVTLWHTIAEKLHYWHGSDVMFTGTYQHNIDSKGRIIIPAKLREELGDAFYVTKGINGCLFALSTQQWKDFVAKITALPIGQSAKLTRFFCSGADEVTPNAQGRILVPDHLRQYARLDKEVTIIGSGSRVEIWNSANWTAYIDEEITDETVLESMEILGI